MFWDKDKKMAVESPTVDQIIDQALSPDPRPFLKRDNPIKDLDSFVNRVYALRRCIDRCAEKITTAEIRIEKLEKGISFISIDVLGDYCGFQFLASEAPDCIKEFADNLIKHCKYEIHEQSELKHTCQDELDWLESKMGLVTNQPRYVDYNFDPEKDHA